LRWARLGELAACFELAGRTIRERSGLEIDLDVAAMQVSANEFFRERILYMALDGSA
jgi:hypothetical protein